MPDFVGRRLRVLRSPHRHRKGRPHIVVAGLEQGWTDHEIVARLGVGEATVSRYREAWCKGRELGPPEQDRDDALAICQRLGSVFDRSHARFPSASKS